MRIFRSPRIEREVIKQVLQAFPEKERVHLAECIFCLRKAYLRRTEQVPLEDSTALLWLGGQFWHSRLGFSETEVEVERDGIVGHIDALLDHRGGEYPVEIKSTRLKPNQEIPQHWVEQLQGYCYMHGSKIGILLVVYSMGDWRDISPQLRAYILGFTAEELEGNWQRIWLQAERLRDHLERKLLPGVDHVFSPRGEWECKNCDVRRFCRSTPGG